MTHTDPNPSPDERHGQSVRRAYANAMLHPERRARHKARLAGATERPGVSRFPRPAGELVAIAAGALLLALAFVVWQALEPGSTEQPETAQAIPFAPPETCPVDAWAGPEDRLAEPEAWTASYFLDGSGIALNARSGVLYEGDNTVVWLRSAYQPQDIVYAAEHVDGESATATFSFDTPATAATGSDGREYTVQSATLSFPTSGCWRISVKSQDSSLRKVVFVYPAEARP